MRVRNTLYIGVSARINLTAYSTRTFARVLLDAPHLLLHGSVETPNTSAASPDGGDFSAPPSPDPSAPTNASGCAHGPGGTGAASATLRRRRTLKKQPHVSLSKTNVTTQSSDDTAAAADLIDRRTLADVLVEKVPFRIQLLLSRSPFRYI